MRVVLYTNNSCVYCKKTKEWLTENNIGYIEKDISAEQNFKEFNQYNVPGVPLMVIFDKKTNAESILRGYTPENFKEHLLI